MVRVEHTTAQDVIRRGGHPLVHVFASARVPGGGWRLGVRGQEEDLCRMSDLGLRLEAKGGAAERFYRAGQRVGPLNTDDVLVIPDVRMGECAFDALLCAAPQCRRVYYTDSTAVRRALERRARRIFQIAARKKRPFVTGAWGCGHFGHDPREVAEVLAHAAAEAPIETVFAVPERGWLPLFDAAAREPHP